LLLGLTRGTSRAHIARAALQSIAWQVADVFMAMQADAAAPLTELRVDGGASANNLLMQMQADALGIPVLRPEVTETTALGAALLAGLAVGVWRGADDIAPAWRAQARFEPRSSAAHRMQEHARWRDAVARARRWAQA
jgi:glycerol kinase